MARRGPCVVALALALLIAAPARAQSPELPPPSYDTTLWAFAYPWTFATGADGAAAVAELDALGFDGGPYVRWGLSQYFIVTMPWNQDLANPVVTPSLAQLTDILTTLASLGSALHLTLEGGMSRAPGIYQQAKLADRRNAQWYGTGAIVSPVQQASTTLNGAASIAYTSASRYARRLRAHLESKLRAFAARMVQLRASFPETLISASGDAEAELNFEALDPALPYEQQLITDYSPFAILEFRDWVLHAGLYADAGPFAGQGYQKVDPATELYAQGGADPLSNANRALFNAAYGTSFATFDLAYFHWSLSDPIDVDPGAIPSGEYGAPGWLPLPSSGPDRIAGGFDAPRVFNQPSAKFWELWLRFRVAMLQHWVEDFATWITTTEHDGETWPAERYYSHQIPADYLNGRDPAVPTPEPRLLSSASPLSTALLPPDLGLPGLTVLDRFELANFGLPGGYNRTSLFLLPTLAALALPHGWGAPEYNPSWHIDVPPETDVPLMRAQMHLAYEAGMRMFAFTPWPHIAAPVGTALRQFLDDVKFQPRQSPAVQFVPPQVAGLTGAAVGAGQLSWRAQIFDGVPDFAWTQWPAFDVFEVWNGETADFTAATGKLVGRTTQTTLTALKSRKPKGSFFKVRALTGAGVTGPLSAAFTIDLQAPKCQRAIAKAAAKLAQTRAQVVGTCDQARLAGKLAAGTDCAAAAGAALAKAEAALAKTVGKACGGTDATCGGSLAGETTGTTLAWPATCPGLDGACTSGAVGVADCTGVAACVACVAGAAVDGTRAVTMTPLAGGGPPTDKAALRCAKTIAQEAQKLAVARSKALLKCWDARLGGKHAGDCPDGKAAAALAKASTAFTAKICKACGGADKACGGADDLVPSTLGFGGTCPGVATPAGAVCDSAIASVADLAVCVACVTEHGADCTDRLPLPQLGPYPDACTP